MHVNVVKFVSFSIKRELYGVCCHVIAEHFRNCINELCFELNNNVNKNVFDTFLNQCIFEGK
jgi:hypothetical protein